MRKNKPLISRGELNAIRIISLAYITQLKQGVLTHAEAKEWLAEKLDVYALPTRDAATKYTPQPGDWSDTFTGETTHPQSKEFRINTAWRWE